MAHRVRLGLQHSALPAGGWGWAMGDFAQCAGVSVSGIRRCAVSVWPVPAARSWPVPRASLPLCACVVPVPAPARWQPAGLLPIAYTRIYFCYIYIYTKYNNNNNSYT